MVVYCFKAPESCLAEIDKEWKYKYWWWQLVQMSQVFSRSGSCVN